MGHVILPPSRVLVLRRAVRAYYVMGTARTSCLVAVDDIYHERGRVNTSIECVVDQIINTGVLATSTTNHAIPAHDATSSSESG